MGYAPVILFVYNRPEHTLRTLEELIKNDLASESKLFVFADGPKKGSSLSELENIQKTREVVKKRSWCKSLTIIERKFNFGLADNVIQGVTQVLNNYGRAIVLEDDILVGSNFLRFMNTCLELYGSESKVYGVSGYSFDSSGSIEDNTYFLPIMSSWGYGTWKDRWDKINFDGADLLRQVEAKKIGLDLNFSKLAYYQMLKDQVNGKNNSWAIRFYVSMFLKKGVFLYPKNSMLINIGFDGSGVHCGTDDSKKNEMSDVENNHIKVEKIKVEVKSSIIKKFNPPTKSTRVSAVRKLKKSIRNMLPPELVTLVRRKFMSDVKSEYDYLKDFPRYRKIQISFRGRTISIPDSASFLFMQEEIFNQQIYQFATEVDKPYIIDGGANIGLATIYFKELFPNAEIIAFEPDKVIYEMLKVNLKSFGLDDVQIENKGLWDKSDVLNFNSEGADAGLVSDIYNSYDSTTSIDVVSLNDYLKKKVDFLKLDIEGSETIVLNNIKDNLDKVERIFVEYHSFVGQPQTLNEIIDILTKAGFRLHINAPGLSTKVPFIKLNTYNNMDMQLNIYGFKKK